MIAFVMPPVGGDPVFPTFPETKRRRRKKNSGEREKSKAIVSDSEQEDGRDAMDEDMDGNANGNR